MCKMTNVKLPNDVSRGVRAMNRRTAWRCDDDWCVIQRTRTTGYVYIKELHRAESASLLSGHIGGHSTRLVLASRCRPRRRRIDHGRRRCQLISAAVPSEAREFDALDFLYRALVHTTLCMSATLYLLARVIIIIPSLGQQPVYVQETRAPTVFRRAYRITEHVSTYDGVIKM